MQKKEFLDYLKSLVGRTAKTIQFAVIPYKHEGTTYGEDSIRITGSKEFIESVLIRLNPSDLLQNENLTTRLQCPYTQVVDRESKQPVPGAYACMIQVHRRGGEAIHINQDCQQQLLGSG